MAQCIDHTANDVGTERQSDSRPGNLQYAKLVLFSLFSISDSGWADTNCAKAIVARERLEVLSALRQLVGSELLSQLRHGLAMLSISVPCGIDLKQRHGKYGPNISRCLR